MALKHYLETYHAIRQNPLNEGRSLGAFLAYLGWNFGHRALDADYILPLAEHARLIVSKRQNFATLLYTCGLWDFDEQLFMLHALRAGDTFVDIGSNVGGYSVLASAVAGAHSLAFEPVPVTFAELQANLRLNDIERLVQPYCMALGSIKGQDRMSALRGGLNHILTATDTAASVTVDVARLDDVLDGQACNLIKIDAEGFELNILRGAPATLARPELRGIIVELNGSGGRYGIADQDVHAEITGYGFKPIAYDPRTRLLTMLPSFRTDGLNTIYVRDPDAVAALVRDSRAYSVRGRSF